MATSNPQRTGARGVIGVALAAWLAAPLGCLPGEHRPEGRQILPGRGLTGLPGVLRAGEGSLVLFETPDATLPHDGRWRNLHAIPFAGGAPRKLLERWLTWFPPVSVGPGLLAALTPPDGVVFPVDPEAETPADRVLRVVDVSTGLVPVTLPGLISLAVLREGFAVLGLPLPSGPSGAALPELTLGDALGATRTLGEVTGTSFARDGAVFFTRAKDDSLLRIDAQRRSVQLLANNVDRFEATRDGAHALVTGLAPGDPVRGIDAAPSGVFPLELTPDDCRRLVRLENAPTVVCVGGAPEHPSVIAVNLARRTVARFMAAPHGSPWLDARITPDESRIALRYPDLIETVDLATGAVQTAAGVIGTPRWNASGSHVAFASLGQLPVADAQPASIDTSYPRLAVLPGSLLGRSLFLSPAQWRLSNFVVLPAAAGLEHVAVAATLQGERVSLFATRLPPLTAFAPESSEPPPEIRLLASDVGHYVTGLGRIVALTSLSSQDHTGDLMFFDLETGAAKLLATDVFDFAAAPPCPTCAALGPGTEVAFIVRTRRPLALEGLWVVALP